MSSYNSDDGSHLRRILDVSSSSEPTQKDDHPKENKIEITDEDVDSRPIMHGFFETLGKGHSKNNADKRLIGAWTTAWTAAGWRVRMLNLSDAQNHPDYKSYVEKLQDVPLGSNDMYDMQCYLRWLAMAAAGGGWMADIDVFPLRHVDDDPLVKKAVERKGPRGVPDNGKPVIYDIQAVPAMVSASAQGYTDMAFAILKEALKHKDAKLFSDMMAFQELKKSGLFSLRGQVITGQWVLGEKPFSKEECFLLDGRRGLHVSHSTMALAMGVPEDKRGLHHRAEIAMRWLNNYTKICNVNLPTGYWNMRTEDGAVDTL